MKGFKRKFDLIPVAVMLLGATTVIGQDYPNKPIRIVAGEIGGSVDFAARIVAQGLTGSLGQQAIVDNRGGIASIPREIVAKAPADGYTLLVSSGALWIGPLMTDTPYDPTRDLSPVTLTNRSILILAVHPSLPVKSVKELIALARAKPGELNYASAGTGAASHLAGELLKSMAGVNIVRIAYKGAGLATNDLISGRVQLSFFSATSVIPHIKSGRLRALAVTGTEPSALVPGLPTVAASGLPGYELMQMYGVFAPTGTPAAIINRLNQEIVRFLKTEKAKERLFNVGSEPVGSSPEEFAVRIKSEMARLGKVIKDAGIRLE